MTTMFRRSLLLSLSIALGGCGNNNTATDGGANDLAMASVPDLAMAAADLGSADLTPANCGMASVGGPQLPNVTPACIACASNQCCTELGTCSANAECVALRDCYKTCDPTDGACNVACNKAHPDGVTDSGAVSKCRNTKCNVECANFSCVGSVNWPAPAKPTYSFTLTVTDYQSSGPVAGATVKVCATADLMCANPLSQTTTDMNGLAKLTAPSSKSGIDAHVEITGAGMVPAIDQFFLNKPSILDGGSFSTPVFSTNTFTLLTNILNVTPDKSRGHIAFQVYDCSNFTAAGVTVAASGADANTQTFYVAGMFPSKTATATDGSGSGATLNVPPGSLTFSATLAASGKTFSKESLVVRAGYITTVNVVPTP